MNPFLPIEGTILSVQPMQTSSQGRSGCTIMISVRTQQGITNLVVTSTTYVLDQTPLRSGERITAFYDSTAPVPLIFPPQFRAVAIARVSRDTQVTLDFFNNNLVNSNGSLRLNVARSTQITLQNGQTFFGNVANRYLLVVYGATTRSIPASTTPDKIVVFCSQSE